MNSWAHTKLGKTGTAGGLSVSLAAHEMGDAGEGIMATRVV